MTIPRVLAGIGLVGALATSASAQGAAAPSFAWGFPGVEFSACVEFLMDPDLAAKQLGPGYQVVPAATFAAISPVLSREASDSLHAGWVPAKVCVIEAPSMTVGGSSLTPDKKMGGQEVVAFWGIAATRPGSSGPLDQWYVAAFWTNDWRMRKQTEAAFVPVTVFKRSMAPVPETTRHHYALQIGKTSLTWEGEIVGRDSTATTAQQQSTLILDGLRGILWTAQVTARPAWTRTLPGVFGVQGNDDLAKALKASPIRMFGPMYWGGETQVGFFR